MKKILLIFAAILFLSPASTHAQDASDATDWYIEDFKSEIIVNKDSSLTITEKIIADCGNLPDKHGIFRTLPAFYQKTTTEKVNTPIKLESITDFDGHALKYSTTKENNTVTWKIGDPNKAVTGKNNYEIKYIVKNAIRFEGSDFDELYWNLNGNFWQIPIDHFDSTIKFPKEIDKTNTQITIYSGTIGEKSNALSTYSWTDNNTLKVTSTKSLNPSEGITLSTTFPKNIISPYKPSLFEKFGSYLFLLIPILIFLFCINIWRRFGKDFKPNRTIMAEYDIPDNLSPIEFATLYSNGKLSPSAITAAIIALAVKGYLKIEQIEKKGMFGKPDYRLTKLESSKPLSVCDKSLLAYLFGGAVEIELKDLVNKFYSNIPRLKDEAINFLSKEDYVEKAGYKWQIGLLIAGILMMIGSSFALASLFFALTGALFVSSLILFIFAALMPKRTQKGAETFLKIHGFRLFISMTEKYRSNFNEKENIFEKFLPYAMIFGLTKIWINNMKKIYGEAYFNSYHPFWFYGSMYTSFDAKAFDSMISGLSSQMNSTISSNPSSSGAGGGGFSGGGGGGGGGGGW